MKRFSSLAVILALAALVVTPALADTLVLKNGTRVTGYYEGGTPRVVKFRDTSGTLKDYDIISVEQVVFEDVPTPVSTAPAPAPAPAAAAAAAPPSGEPRLRPASERPPAQPTSSSAASTGYTVPTGSKVVIRMIDSINSETH